MSRSPERSFLSVSCSFEDAMGACENEHAMCRGKSKLGKIEANTVARAPSSLSQKPELKSKIRLPEFSRLVFERGAPNLGIRQGAAVRGGSAVRV